jgi:DNA-nicking Smr family endonuclease
MVPELVELPITRELDLHSFDPRDIPPLVGDYLDLCREQGFASVRLIHGRGRGVQRAVVRRALSARSDVLSFDDAPAELGGWGATVVWLRR